MSRRAFTLVELVVAIGLAALVATGVFALFSSGATGSYRLSERAAAEQDARLALQSMTQELEEGTRLFFPRPGEGPRDGVGFVNARGELVIYYVARFGRAARDGRPALRRACLSVKNPSDELVVEGVRHLRASTPRTSPGRRASAVLLDLAVDSLTPGIDANFVTGATLRAADRATGDEPPPPGEVAP